DDEGAGEARPLRCFRGVLRGRQHDAAVAVVAGEPLHGAVRENGAYLGVDEAGQQPLRLTERVAEEHGGAAGVAVVAPPGGAIGGGACRLPLSRWWRVARSPAPCV